jgi:hypothetical protein
MGFSEQPMVRRAMECPAFALATILALACHAEPPAREQTSTPLESPSQITAPTEERPLVKPNVPQGILNPILNEAGALAKVPREQLVIVRAEAVVWNDGSLGCPEPGMEYAQALVNGYWVVINAAGQTYDFRVGPGGSFRLCPAGRGHPPLPSDAT